MLSYYHLPSPSLVPSSSLFLLLAVSLKRCQIGGCSDVWSAYSFRRLESEKITSCPVPDKPSCPSCSSRKMCVSLIWQINLQRIAALRYCCRAIERKESFCVCNNVNNLQGSLIAGKLLFNHEKRAMDQKRKRLFALEFNYILVK